MMTSHFSIKFLHTCISYERNSFNNIEIVSETDSESELVVNLSEVTFSFGTEKVMSNMMNEETLEYVPYARF